MLIPNFNMAEFLSEAIQSCISQSVQPSEIVVADNASEDRSLSLLKNLNLPSLRVLKQEKNIGIFANINSGFAFAKSDYVKILCADDVMHPRCIENLLSRICEIGTPKYALSVGVALMREGLDHPADNVIFTRTEFDNVPELIANKVPLSLSDMCYHRKTFCEFGGFGVEGLDQAFSRDAVTALRFASRYGMDWTASKLVFERPHPMQNRRFMPKLNQIDEFLQVFQELKIGSDPRIRRAIDTLVGNHLGSGFARLLGFQGASYLREVLRRTNSYQCLHFRQFILGIRQLPRLMLSRIPKTK